MSWYEFRPYVPVAQRRARAAKYAERLAKKEGRVLAPIKIDGRKITASFWGNAWCENLERYSDFANRLPRGRTYVRNGSVIDLQIERGKVRAFVSGSEVYKVKIDIKTLKKDSWSRIKKDCSRSIDSLIDLLQGRFAEGIMQRLTERDGGLFPKPAEIEMACSCPDWAGMCKHVAATLYGIGARLDKEPVLLFTLRDVDHLELIGQAVDSDNLKQAFQGSSDPALAGADLGAVFGIDLDTVADRPAADPADATADALTPKARPRRPSRQSSAKKRKSIREKLVKANQAKPSASKPARPRRKRVAVAPS